MAIASTDYFVSNAAAFLSLVGSWSLVGGVRQVPDGRDVVVQLQNAGAGFTLNAKFNHQVTLRSTGPYAMNYDLANYEFLPGGSGTDLSSGVTISDCVNLRLYALKINGTITANRVENCVLERCWGNGQEFPLTKSAADTSGTTGTLLTANGVNGLLVKDCHFAHSSNSHLSFGYDTRYPTGLTLSGITADHYRHDFLKFLNGSVNLIIEDTWEPRTRCRVGIGTAGAHTDFIQTQGGLHSNTILRRNVCMYGPDINGNSSPLQGYYWRHDTGASNYAITQSILCQNSANAYFMENPDAGVVRTGITVYYCDALRYDMNDAANDTNLSMPLFRGMGTDYNIGTVTSNYTTPLGPNGVWLDWGDVQDGDWDHSNYNTTDYYSGIPRNTTGFEVFKPKNSSVRTHWDHVNPVGAYELKQRVFELGLHPGNVGWPVAEPWTRQYNFNGGIASNYTGEYDANADNAGGTPTAPVITGVPTISVTPNVGQTLTITPAPVSGYPAPTNEFDVYNTVDGLVQSSSDLNYTLQATDEDDQMYVIQRSTNSEDTDTSDPSASTAVIGAALAAPVITLLSPYDGEADVSVSSQLIVTFDQNVRFGTGGVYLWRLGIIREPWYAASDVGFGPHTINIVDNVLTITSIGDMRLGADYHITMDNGFIESMSGIPFPGITDTTTWNWSTYAVATPKQLARAITMSITVE